MLNSRIGSDQNIQFQTLLKVKNNYDAWFFKNNFFVFLMLERVIKSTFVNIRPTLDELI